jgi:hypothetical protein
MLSAGETRYPMCLLDTMAVSAMVKEPSFFRSFYDWALADEPPYVPCFTIYTLMELRRRLELFGQFIEVFKILPCVMVKGYAHLLEEEIASYPDPRGIEPDAIVFTPFGDEGNQLSNLPQLLELFADKEAEWNRGAPEIVEGALELVPNYPPDGSAYTREEIKAFVFAASFRQLALHEPDWVRAKVNDTGEHVDMDAFPVFKMMTFTVFYKFYSNRERKPTPSDAFDMLISSALPYVEAVITEGHLADALGKVKRVDDFLGELEVFTLRDFRDGRPARR